MFSFCLIWFTCNIAFNFTREAGNGLLGGMSALRCCCCFSWVNFRRKKNTVLYICPANTFFFTVYLPSQVPPPFLRGVSKCLALACGGNNPPSPSLDFCPTWAFTVSVPVCRFGKCVCACVCLYVFGNCTIWCCTVGVVEHKQECMF